MEPWIFSTIIALGGLYFVVRNVRLLRDETKLREYLLISPKAKLWVSRLGMERTIVLTRKYFLPVGLLIGLGLCGSGLFGLWTYFQTR